MNNLQVQINGLVSVLGNVNVSNFPDTQVVSPFPSTTPIVSVSPIITAATGPIRIVAANPSRKGLSLYNQSGNSIYLKIGSAGNSSTDMSLICTNFQHISLSQLYPGVLPIWEVWGVRTGSGTGPVVTTEFI